MVWNSLEMYFQKLIFYLRKIKEKQFKIIVCSSSDFSSGKGQDAWGWWPPAPQALPQISGDDNLIQANSEGPVVAYWLMITEELSHPGSVISIRPSSISHIRPETKPCVRIITLTLTLVIVRFYKDSRVLYVHWIPNILHSQFRWRAKCLLNPLRSAIALCVPQ